MSGAPARHHLAVTIVTFARILTLTGTLYTPRSTRAQRL